MVNYISNYMRYMRNDFLDDMNPVKHLDYLYNRTTKLQKAVSAVAFVALFSASRLLYSAARTSFHGSYVPHCALGIALIAPSIILFNLKRLRNQKVVSAVALAAFFIAMEFTFDSVKATLGKQRGNFVINSCFGLAFAITIIGALKNLKEDYDFKHR